MFKWLKTSPIDNVNYTCGYCCKDTAPSKAYFTEDSSASIYICPNCTKPTFVDYHRKKQTPPMKYGRELQGITSTDVAQLYKEARDCTTVGAYTASALICRKILMNLAVQHGAKENESFVYYVDYLTEKGFVPPNGRTWVDAIRLKGNEATHEIELMDNKDAQLVLHFTEALLRFNYEMPHLLENHNKP